MSRIGKQPVVIPSGVDVTLANGSITVKGPKGTLSRAIHPRMTVTLGEDEGQKTVNVSIGEQDDVEVRALWGTTRSNIQNMIVGVVDGFKKALEVVGVGYRVNAQGNKVVLDVGYSHSVDFILPEGVKAEVEKNTLTLSGINKEVVGEAAAQIRRIRKPEPYGGKGIKYVDEVIRRKAGKAAKTGE